MFSRVRRSSRSGGDSAAPDTASEPKERSIGQPENWDLLILLAIVAVISLMAALLVCRRLILWLTDPRAIQASAWALLAVAALGFLLIPLGAWWQHRYSTATRRREKYARPSGARRLGDRVTPLVAYVLGAAMLIGYSYMLVHPQDKRLGQYLYLAGASYIIAALVVVGIKLYRLHRKSTITNAVEVTHEKLRSSKDATPAAARTSAPPSGAPSSGPRPGGDNRGERSGGGRDGNRGGGHNGSQHPGRPAAATSGGH